MLPDEARSAIACERMHWTFQEYLDQPEWFIRMLFMKWGIDSDNNKKGSEE